MRLFTPYPTALIHFVFQLLARRGDALSPLKVTQPAALSATVGGSVTLKCFFPDQNGIMVQAAWCRRSQPWKTLDDMHSDYTGRLTMSSLEENSRGEARLGIQELTLNDSDIYFCKVTSFSGSKGEGNGTRLEVISLQSPSDALSPLKVMQSAALSATVGGSVTLKCTFPDQNGIMVQAAWCQRSQPWKTLDDVHSDYTGRLTMSSLEKNSRGEARLGIQALTLNDSDIYFCKVTSFSGSKGEGNGTRLEVISLQSPICKEFRVPHKQEEISSGAITEFGLYWSQLQDKCEESVPFSSNNNAVMLPFGATSEEIRSPGERWLQVQGGGNSVHRSLGLFLPGAGGSSYYTTLVFNLSELRCLHCVAFYTDSVCVMDRDSGPISGVFLLSQT
ncbi:hypothetical protein NDU88_000886 [Pleurodeles waltl]|uniref:Ig-like domain-containing protein n=1 Tax=Pleurodeles waltl TaxID=8319 RepID=A0AAV7Q5G9_PLEWA|nr:hypothetical protein NDU88_000886 [Pleurodeles waltl]